LDEQHGNLDSLQVLGAIDRRFSRRVQRKPEKYEPLNVFQETFGLGLRGHSSAKGFASSEQRQVRHLIASDLERGSHGCAAQRRRVRPLATPLHIGELVSQARHLEGGETRRDVGHEGMVHACSGTMRQYRTQTRVQRAQKQPGNSGRPVDMDR
jgi:hypothetical protein